MITTRIAPPEKNLFRHDHPQRPGKDPETRSKLSRLLRPIPGLLFILTFSLISSCNKEVREPKHKNNGSNVLYFNIDGKGYLLRDRCLDFPSKKTGDIFGGSDRKSLPQFVTYERTDTIRNSLNFSYVFDKTEEGNSSFGNFFIEFTNINNVIKVNSLGTNSRFYSPTQKKQVVFWSKNYVEWPTLKIFNYNKFAEHIAGELRFKYFEIDSTKIVDFYLYFDLDVKPSY